MKSEAEIRERILYWGKIREGVLVGKGTKKTIKHLIEELLWVLGDEGEGAVWEALQKEAEVSDDKEDRLRVLPTGELVPINEWREYNRERTPDARFDCTRLRRKSKKIDKSRG